MPNVRINNKSVEYEFQDFPTLNDFLEHVSSDEESAENMITSISVDGEALSLENRSTWVGKSPEEIGLIEIEMENTNEVALEAIETAIEHADAIIPVLRLAGIDYSATENREHQNFFMTLDALELFIRLVSQIRETVNVGGDLKISQKESIHDIENNLYTVMKNILSAKENEDYVALSELLQIDLLDNMIKWRDQALPKMKSLMSS